MAPVEQASIATSLSTGVTSWHYLGGMFIFSGGILWYGNSRCIYLTHFTVREEHPTLQTRLGSVCERTLSEHTYRLDCLYPVAHCLFFTSMAAPYYANSELEHRECHEYHWRPRDISLRGGLLLMVGFSLAARRYLARSLLP